MPTENLPPDIPKPPFRLTNRGKRPRTARMKRFLKKLGIPLSAYYRWSGDQPLNAFVKENPNWTGRAWEVLVLENRDIILGQPQTADESPDADRLQRKILGGSTNAAL